MTKNKYLTNHQLLQELKERLPNFTQDELHTLLAIMQPYQERVLKIIQNESPEVYNSIKKEQEKWQKEKTDKEIDQLKKSLPDK